jgi:thiamine-phosphate pyrophosphorylase
VGKAAGTAVVINDRVDIALVTGADGVHLGQDDLPVTEARRLLGPDAIIGLSTHNLDQVEQARRLPVDYVAFGPIFETATKADHEPVTGARQLRNIRKAVNDIPLVAIGGITPENLISVLENGANSAAMISGLYRSADGIRAAFRRLYEIAELKNIVGRG